MGNWLKAEDSKSPRTGDISNNKINEKPVINLPKGVIIGKPGANLTEERLNTVKLNK